MSLPQTGDSAWGVPLNEYITNVVLAQANTAAGNITAHVSGSDPHGDRAYALGLVTPLTSGINGPNGLLQLDGTGRIPSSALPAGGGRTSTFDVVKDYSAPTNGTAAASAIQSALNDAGTDGGGEVWVGDGTFGIDSTLYVPSNVWLHLSPGATMNRIVNSGSGLAPAYMVANFNGSVSAAGTGTILVDGGSWVFDSQSAAGVPFAFVGGSDITVRNASIRTLPGSAAVLLAGCSYVIINGTEYSSAAPVSARTAYASVQPAVRVETAANTVISGLNSGMYTGAACTSVMISNCAITGSTSSDGTGLYTAFGGLAGTTAAVASSFHTAVMVQGNTAIALPYNATYPKNWQTMTVTGNQFNLNNGSTSLAAWNPSAPGTTNQIVANNGATDGGSGSYAYKSSSTSRSSTTSLTLDPALQLTVAANGVYEVRAIVFFQSATAGATPGFAFNMQLPSGTFIYKTMDGVNVSSDQIAEDFQDTAGTPDWDSVAFSNTPDPQEMSGILLVGSTGGTFGLKWAQHASSSTAVTVSTGSYIVLTRLA